MLASRRDRAADELWPVFGRGPGCRGVAARSYRNNVRGATLVPYTDKLYAHSANLMTRGSRYFYGVLLGVLLRVLPGPTLNQRVQGSSP